MAAEPAASEASVGEALAQARRLGRLEAEHFDQRCRDREQRERESRLALLALHQAAPLADSPAGGRPVASTSEVARLRSQVEALAAFQTALFRSRSWRALQAMKRPFGRAW